MTTPHNTQSEPQTRFGTKLQGLSFGRHPLKDKFTLDSGVQSGTGSPDTNFLRTRRLESFWGWPKYAEKNKVELVESYLIHTGRWDETKCVYCNKTYSQWQDDGTHNLCYGHETWCGVSRRYMSFRNYRETEEDQEKFKAIRAVDFCRWGLWYTSPGETTCEYCKFVQNNWNKGDGILHGHYKTCCFPAYLKSKKIDELSIYQATQS